MRSLLPPPTISEPTTGCELKFTFDAESAGLNSRPSPTLSFPCWKVGEGRRHPRLPNSHFRISVGNAAAKKLPGRSSQRLDGPLHQEAGTPRALRRQAT